MAVGSKSAFMISNAVNTSAVDNTANSVTVNLLGIVILLCELY